MMQKIMSQQVIGFAWAIGCLLASTTGANAYQLQQVGNLSVAFHIPPYDRPIANQPSEVWVQIKQGESIVARSECQGCRLSLLAPDGQMLNQFDGDELQSLTATEGAFGTTMIFGAPGEFVVQLEGTVDQQPINLLFPVPVQPEQN
jgi:hypothetical protein